ncbi:MAG: hypothetical protein RR975_14045, partial [Clostridia bacterium]
MVNQSEIQPKYRRRMKQVLGFNFYDVFVFVFCVGFALICFYPMWYVLIASVMPYEEYIGNSAFLLWPKTFDFQYYQAIFATKAFTSSLWISTSKTILATALSLAVT